MAISTAQLSATAGVRIKSFSSARWSNLKSNMPNTTVYGGGKIGVDGVITKSYAGELAFYYDAYGNLSIVPASPYGWGSGGSLEYAAELVTNLSKASDVEMLSSMEANAARRECAELVRPR
jgi:hypothetical protein